MNALTRGSCGSQSGVPAYEVSSSDEKADGLDLDLRWRATPHFTFYGAAEYIDQKYKNHTASDGTDISGQPVGTPKLTATLGADTMWPLAGGTAIATLQGAYTGPTRCNGDSLGQGTCLTTPTFRVGEAMTDKAGAAQLGRREHRVKREQPVASTGLEIRVRRHRLNFGSADQVVAGVMSRLNRFQRVTLRPPRLTPVGRRKS